MIKTKMYIQSTRPYIQMATNDISYHVEWYSDLTFTYKSANYRTYPFSFSMIHITAHTCFDIS